MEDTPWKPLVKIVTFSSVNCSKLFVCVCACTVEKLLSMCSSSCLPGGGSNTELALHCLHYCHGNTMVNSHEEY